MSAAAGRGTPSQRLPRSRLATSHRDRGFTTASTPADAAARMAPICSAAMSGRKLLGTDERLRSSLRRRATTSNSS